MFSKKNKEFKKFLVCFFSSLLFLHCTNKKHKVSSDLFGTGACVGFKAEYLKKDKNVRISWTSASRKQKIMITQYNLNTKESVELYNDSGVFNGSNFVYDSPVEDVTTYTYRCVVYDSQHDEINTKVNPAEVSAREPDFPILTKNNGSTKITVNHYNDGTDERATCPYFEGSTFENSAKFRWTSVDPSETIEISRYLKQNNDFTLDKIVYTGFGFFDGTNYVYDTDLITNQEYIYKCTILNSISNSIEPQLTVSLIADGLPLDGHLYPVGIVNNPTGPKKTIFNFLILGDGFLKKDLEPWESFEQNTTTLMQQWLSIYPFPLIADKINVYRINSISNERGASKEDYIKTDGVSCFHGTVIRDTKFNSSFCTNGIDRLLVPNNTTALNDVIHSIANKISVDLKIMLVNTNTYGGSGGDTAVISLHRLSKFIGIHEIGHSISSEKIGDEYDYGDNNRDESVKTYNTDIKTYTNGTFNPDFPKWKAFLTGGQYGSNYSTVLTNQIGSDTFEGGFYNKTNVWRPQQHCMMKDYYGFCAVCAYHIVNIVYTKVGLTLSEQEFMNNFLFYDNSIQYPQGTETTTRIFSGLNTSPESMQCFSAAKNNIKTK